MMHFWGAPQRLGVERSRELKEVVENGVIFKLYVVERRIPKSLQSVYVT